MPIAVSEILGSANDTAEAAALDVLACLLKYGTCLTSKQISSVGSGVGFEPLRKCLLDAVCLATNPLLVGMTLSLQLEDAAGCGREGQRQMASRLQKEVEDLVLEVFERLPQTVDGFQNGDTLGEGMKVGYVFFLCFQILEGSLRFPLHSSTPVFYVSAPLVSAGKHQ